MRHTLVVSFSLCMMLTVGQLHAATDPHPLQPAAPRTVIVSEAETPPQVRAGLLQSTLIVLPTEEKVANVFAGDTVNWVFDGGHALCNAHHLRELIFAHEEHGQQWAARLKACLLEANEEITTAKTRGATELPARRLQYFSDRYSRILREGREELPLLPARPAGQRGRAKQHKVKNLHDRLRDRKTEVLAFLYDFSIPFTSNQGEQDVRMMKVKQKISGCFRSFDGARIFARIRGCFSTVKKQGHNTLQAMTMLFDDHVDFTRKMTELAEPT